MAEYSVLSKVLHRLALGQSFIAEASFQAECALQLKSSQLSHNGAHLFVSGVARAGTTILMRSLYETGVFCSLTYRDMPFVLAPNLWGSISGNFNKDMDAQQRIHGDGIKIDYDSPEALEEVFWRIFTGKEYIYEDCLVPMNASDEIIGKFRQYISLIMKRYACDRYLSKNNNNVLRIPSIKKSFPNSKILIPFRDPLQQALSLYNQHKLFNKQHRDDLFTKSYMDWLVHHEFGSGHRPFLWGVESSRSYGLNDIEYWLEYWVGVYSHLLTQFKNDTNIIFVSYDSLCENTIDEWSHLMSCIDVPVNRFPELSRKISDVSDINNSELLEKSHRLFEGLKLEYRKNCLQMSL